MKGQNKLHRSAPPIGSSGTLGGAGQTSSASCDSLSTPQVYHERDTTVNTPDNDLGLARDLELELERELHGFWAAYDRNAIPEADAHAANYRTLVQGRRAAEINARLLRLEKEQALLDGKLRDMEQRLCNLDIYYGQEGDDDTDD